MGNNLRILYIGNRLAGHGRTPTGIDTLGKLLEQEGHIVYYSSNKLNKIFRIADMLSSIWSNRNKIEVVLIDTYSTTAFYFAWACGRFCKMLGIKYIPILHGGNLPERFKRSPVKCRQLLGASFANVTVSAYLQEHMEKEGYKGVTIGNAIALRHYPFRQRSSLQPNILWVRAFHQTYNPDMAISAFAAIAKEFPQAKLTMVGPDLDGSLARCKQRSVEYGLESNVRFTGKLSKQEWTTLAEQSDIFINTSNFDNQPVSLIEAQALGLPVVSTNVGGIPYLIEDGKTGMLVHVDDADAMSNAMKQLLKEDSLASQLSINGRRVAEQFDWSIIKNKWERLFFTIDKVIEPL